MAIQQIGIGAIVNDGTGDPLRTAFEKINANFTDPANAASKLVGTGAGDVPTNGDLGTGANADVQTSPTDATVDALMAVGAFGLGSVVSEASIDCDTFLESGRRGHSTSVSNGPSGQTFGIVVCDYYTTGSSGRGSQHFIGTSGIGIWQRTMTSGTWSAWQPVYTGANYQPEITLDPLGVVKQLFNVGGVVPNATTVGGTNLRVFISDSAGTITTSGSAPGGTWRNVTGMDVPNVMAGYFVRIA